jgi:integrase
MELLLNDNLVRSIENQQTEIEIYDSKVSGLAIRIYPTGSKSFVYRFKWDGKSKRYTIGQFPKITVTQSREIARDLYAKIRLGINPLLEKKELIENQRSPLFNQLKKEYIEKYLPTIRSSTSKEFKRIIDTELVSLYKTQLNQISKTQVIKLLDIKAFGQKHPTQANQIKIVLSSMFSFAVRRDMIDTNILLSVPTYFTGDSQRHRYFSELEIKMIWSKIERMPSPTKEAFKILFLLGQRKTETLQMKWDHIDECNLVWVIPPSLEKNKQEHHVPLPTMAFNILQDIKQTSEYVFQSPVISNEPIKSIKRQTKSVKENTPVKDFRVHDIRRTKATYLAKFGTNRTIIGKILNHKGMSGDNSITAIYDRYSYEQEKRVALQNWETFLLDQISC